MDEAKCSRDTIEIVVISFVPRGTPFEKENFSRDENFPLHWENISPRLVLNLE